MKKTLFLLALFTVVISACSLTGEKKTATTWTEIVAKNPPTININSKSLVELLAENKTTDPQFASFNLKNEQNNLNSKDFKAESSGGSSAKTINLTHDTTNDQLWVEEIKGLVGSKTYTPYFKAVVDFKTTDDQTYWFNKVEKSPFFYICTEDTDRCKNLTETKKEFTSGFAGVDIERIYLLNIKDLKEKMKILNVEKIDFTLSLESGTAETIISNTITINFISSIASADDNICIDSDNGINYAEKGSIKFSNKSGSGGSGEAFDTCTGVGEGLSEYVCGDDSCGYSIVYDTLDRKNPKYMLGYDNGNCNKEIVEHGYTYDCSLEGKICSEGKCVPKESQRCIPNWECSNWGDCQQFSDNSFNQTRICEDKNDCRIIIDKPTEIQTCSDDEISEDSNHGMIFKGIYVCDSNECKDNEGIANAILFDSTGKKIQSSDIALLDDNGIVLSDNSKMNLKQTYYIRSSEQISNFKFDANGSIIGVPRVKFLFSLPKSETDKIDSCGGSSENNTQGYNFENVTCYFDTSSTESKLWVSLGVLDSASTDYTKNNFIIDFYLQVHGKHSVTFGRPNIQLALPTETAPAEPAPAIPPAEPTPATPSTTEDVNGKLTNSATCFMDANGACMSEIEIKDNNYMNMTDIYFSQTITNFTFKRDCITLEESTICKNQTENPEEEIRLLDIDENNKKNNTISIFCDNKNNNKVSTNIYWGNASNQRIKIICSKTIDKPWFAPKGYTFYTGENSDINTQGVTLNSCTVSNPKISCVINSDKSSFNVSVPYNIESGAYGITVNYDNNKSFSDVIGVYKEDLLPLFDCKRNSIINEFTKPTPQFKLNDSISFCVIGGDGNYNVITDDFLTANNDGIIIGKKYTFSCNSVGTKKFTISDGSGISYSKDIECIAN